MKESERDLDYHGKQAKERKAPQKHFVFSLGRKKKICYYSESTKISKVKSSVPGHGDTATESSRNY